MKKILLPLCIWLTQGAMAQNVAINSTGALPVNSAALDIDMANKGMLIPRIALTTTATFAPVTGVATVSLLIYNTATAGVAPNDVIPGYYYWTGASWIRFISKSDAQTIGDVKYGFQSADHTGWIKMDGRLITSLTASQQAASTTLGFVGNLPNATDKTIKQKAVLNSTGGANTVTVAQANLPNVTFTGTATNTTVAGQTLGNSGAISNGQYGMPQRSNGNANTTTGVDVSPGELNIFDAPQNHGHAVSVSSGGSGSALSIENSYLGVNAFIYLGE
jgi:hypothetical protein